MLCGLCKKRPVEAIVKTDEGSANLCGACFQRYRLLKAAGEIEGLSDYFYMFDEFNPITACPTNLGAGMRASVMMFLPAMFILLTVYKSLSNLLAQTF